MRAVTVTTPGASHRLAGQLSQHEALGVGGGRPPPRWRAVDAGGGVTRRVRRADGFLCLLAVTPAGFINSLVRGGKAHRGSSASRSKCAGAALYNAHLDSNCRTRLIPFFFFFFFSRAPASPSAEGSLAARLLIGRLTLTDTSTNF